MAALPDGYGYRNLYWGYGGLLGTTASTKSQLTGGKNMSVVSKLKQLALSKDDRLLRKYEIVSDCGELTKDGQDVMWGILLEAHKVELVKRVKELDEEEKSQKKK